MTQTTSGGIDALRTSVEGAVHGPGDEGYDGARKVWNADIDRRPGVSSDASRPRTLRPPFGSPRPRDGNHGPRWCPQHSRPLVCDDGLVIDLRR